MDPVVQTETVTLSNGKTLQVRPLKRSQLGRILAVCGEGESKDLLRVEYIVRAAVVGQKKRETLAAGVTLAPQEIYDEIPIGDINAINVVAMRDINALNAVQDEGSPEGN